MLPPPVDVEEHACSLPHDVAKLEEDVIMLFCEVANMARAHWLRARGQGLLVQRRLSGLGTGLRRGPSEGPLFGRE